MSAFKFKIGAIVQDKTRGAWMRKITNYDHLGYYSFIFKRNASPVNRVIDVNSKDYVEAYYVLAPKLYQLFYG